MRTVNRAWAAVATVAVAALTSLSLSAAFAQDAAAVVDQGHVDLLAPVVTDGVLDLRYKDGNTTPPTWHDPEQVVTHIKPESRIQVPDLPEYSFLGPVGSDLWLIPEVQDPNVVWAGWNTESLTATQVNPDSVRWTLDSIAGDERGAPAPGKLTVFQSGPFGEPLPRVFDTSQPLPQNHPLALGTHAHANWTFSAEGVYRLTFTVQATTPAGAPLRDTATYTIAVGDVDPGTVHPGVPTTTTTTTTTTTATTTTAATTTAATTTKSTTTTAPPTSCVVLNDGHVDLIAPRLREGALRTDIKDGTAGPDAAVWRDPSDVVLHLVPAARNTVPNDPAYGFLGTPGAPVWLIPQTQIPGIVWAGWNTESLNPKDVSGDVSIRVSAVDGPARMAVFLTGLIPTVLVDSTNGLPDGITVPLGTHAHANWAFGVEGIYRITVEVTATLADGRTAADSDVFTIAVGAADPTAGRSCAPPATMTSKAPGTLISTAITAAPVPPRGGLASTGVSGLGTAVLLAALLTTGGVAALLLSRRRRH